MVGFSPISARVLASALVLACAGAFGPTGPKATAETPLAVEPGQVSNAAGDIAFPHKYKNWPVLSMTQRPDKETLRVVLGKLTAVRAARRGDINPWPDGSIIASTLWKQAPDQGTAQALSTGDFIRAEFMFAEFMFKDVEKYASHDSGWAWHGGMEQT
ncbi:MAG: cytochrome P460 family protein [Myxococcales bacterium]|nr:cytochrome P460 family protein [Myxococcales bacterium]